jgi:hypothetical protein
MIGAKTGMNGMKKGMEGWALMPLKYCKQFDRSVSRAHPFNAQH